MKQDKPIEVRITRNGESIKAGTVYFRDLPRGAGYQFIPATSARGNSRRLWDTPQAAIPRWIGDYELIYPTDTLL